MHFVKHPGGNLGTTCGLTSGGAFGCKIANNVFGNVDFGSKLAQHGANCGTGKRGSRCTFYYQQAANADAAHGLGAGIGHQRVDYIDEQIAPRATNDEQY